MIADSPNALITYRGEIPPELQSALAPLLERHLCLLPDWLHHLNVSYYSSTPKDSERTAASTTIDYEYRTAYLYIFPAFFMTNNDKRCEFIQHEMIHATVNPIYNYVLGIIGKLFDSDALKDQKVLKEIILEQLRVHNESVATDLQKIVGKLMDKQ